MCVVISIDGYRDGGTKKIDVYENERIVEYCIDRRIGSSTKGMIYLGYPKEDNSNFIEDQEVTKEKLIEAYLNLFQK